MTRDKIDHLWQQALRGAVPAGWKLVPIKATEAMLQAGAFRLGPFSTWVAMLAAAPQPAAQQEPSGEPYGQVTTHAATGQQFFYRWPQPPYLDNASECVAVFTRPSVPLKDEQIKQVFDNLPSAHEKAWFIRYARAIEAAHKIGGAE